MQALAKILQAARPPLEHLLQVLAILLLDRLGGAALLALPRAVHAALGPRRLDLVHALALQQVLGHLGPAEDAADVEQRRALAVRRPDDAVQAAALEVVRLGAREGRGPALEHGVVGPRDVRHDHVRLGELRRAGRLHAHEEGHFRAHLQPHAGLAVHVHQGAVRLFRGFLAGDHAGLSVFLLFGAAAAARGRWHGEGGAVAVAVYDVVDDGSGLLAVGDGGPTAFLSFLK